MMITSFRFGSALVASNPLPIPSREECPGCTFGTYHCPRKCKEEDRGRQLRLYHFDFGYHQSECFEEIPAEKGKAMLDIDAWCAEPLSVMFMDCDNMHTMAFQGPTMLRTCVGGEAEVGLVREQCYWQCKNERPIARCVWQFDVEGKLDVHSHAEDCWMSEQCNSHQQVQVDVACAPLNGTVSHSKHAAALEAAEAARKEQIDKRIKELQSELDTLNSNHSSLRGEAKSFQEEVARLKEELKGMEMAHVHARVEATDLQEQIEALGQHHNSTIILHSAELSALRSAFAQEVVAWEETVHEEQEAHNKTKHELKRVRSDLEQSDEENTTLRWSVLITCVLALFGICGTTVIAIWAWKRRKHIHVQDFSDIVVGQPVAGGEKWNPAKKKTGSPTNAWKLEPGLPVSVARAPSRDTDVPH